MKFNSCLSLIISSFLFIKCSNSTGISERPKIFNFDLLDNNHLFNSNKDKENSNNKQSQPDLGSFVGSPSSSSDAVKSPNDNVDLDKLVNVVYITVEPTTVYLTVTATMTKTTEVAKTTTVYINNDDNEVVMTPVITDSYMAPDPATVFVSNTEALPNATSPIISTTTTTAAFKSSPTTTRTASSASSEIYTKPYSPFSSSTFTKTSLSNGNVKEGEFIIGKDQQKVTSQTPALTTLTNPRTTDSISTSTLVAISASSDDYSYALTSIPSLREWGGYYSEPTTSRALVQTNFIQSKAISSSLSTPSTLIFNSRLPLASNNTYINGTNDYSGDDEDDSEGGFNPYKDIPGEEDIEFNFSNDSYQATKISLETYLIGVLSLGFMIGLFAL